MVLKRCNVWCYVMLTSKFLLCRSSFLILHMRAFIQTLHGVYKFCNFTNHVLTQEFWRSPTIHQTLACHTTEHWRRWLDIGVTIRHKSDPLDFGVLHKLYTCTVFIFWGNDTHFEILKSVIVIRFCNIFFIIVNIGWCPVPPNKRIEHKFSEHRTPSLKHMSIYFVKLWMSNCIRKKILNLCCIILRCSLHCLWY